jgi:DNA-binding NarL/FixJ family response regulator
MVLLESAPPDGGGIAAIRAITQRCLNLRVLVLSSHVSPEAFAEANAAGAVDYILKDISLDASGEYHSRAGRLH